MKTIFKMAAVAFVTSLAFYAVADSVGYYFNYSNQLIDLPYPGDTFYGEVELQCPIPNNLDFSANPFTSPGEFDYLGNYIYSPLVAGANFGVQKFTMDSTVIVSEGDFNNFLLLYDIILPEHWECRWNGEISEFGHFEFAYVGPGGARQDPLVVNISPKSGAVLTGYEFDSVYDFVEKNDAGYYFAAHIAGFTTDPSFWDNGYTNVNSAYFAVGDYNGEPPIIPEPASLLLIALEILGMLRANRR